MQISSIGPDIFEFDSGVCEVKVRIDLEILEYFLDLVFWCWFSLLDICEVADSAEVQTVYSYRCWNVS